MHGGAQHSSYNLRSQAARFVQVMLWNFSRPDDPPRCVHTRHDLNIFGVQFLPGSNSSKIVTGAYDRSVQLHDLGRSLTSAPGPFRKAGRRPAYERVEYCHTTVFNNHSESVKVRRPSPLRACATSLDVLCHFFACSRTVSVSVVGGSSTKAPVVPVVATHEEHWTCCLPGLGIDAVTFWLATFWKRASKLAIVPQCCGERHNLACCPACCMTLRLACHPSSASACHAFCIGSAITHSVQTAMQGMTFMFFDTGLV
jgi:hypothetical protein